MTSFQRNAIITGYINSYCLVCDCFFEDEEHTFSHIKDEGHKTKIRLYPYIEKYGNNCIRKVKAGYFCEHCSLLMATAAKVNMHIADKLHYHNKGNSLLKRSGSVLTAFDDVLISESAWHSFADDACAVCDIEFDEPDEHKIERTHVLKLLQNKVEFADENNIYRKIDKNHFQCLTCNCVPLLSGLDDHFKDDSHKQKYVECQKEKKNHDLANQREKVTEIKAETGKKETESKNQNAVNNKTVAGNAVTKNTEVPKLDTKNTSTKDAKPNGTDPATYAKDNKLAYDPKNTNAYCKTCAKKFPSTLRGMKEHVQGRDHINKTAKAVTKPPPKKSNLKTQPMETFIKDIAGFNNTHGNDNILNGTICIPEISFHFLTNTGCMIAEYKCQICLTDVGVDDLKEHCQTAKHERGMREALVVLDLKNEFVREVHAESFHCGYCNLVIAGWSATKEHLQTQEHKTSTATCLRRFQMHLPTMRAMNHDNVNPASVFHMLVNHMRF